MSRDDRRYSRVYHEAVDDPKFRDVWNDDARLALWVRLLVMADAAWPASATLPRSARAKPLAALVDCGLIDLANGDQFRVHGLDAERGRRSGLAAHAAQSRWDAERTADSNAERTADVMPRREREEKETRQGVDVSTRASDDGRADLEMFLLIRRRAPTAKQRRLLDEVLDRHDLTGPAWAADIMAKHPDDPIGAVIEADKAYRAKRIAEAAAQEAPKPAPRRSPGLPQTTREIMAEMALLKSEAG